MWGIGRRPGRFDGAVALACLALLCAGCGSPRVEARPAKPQRIVALAPSIAETLFALGLGERVAGVTSDCTYPAEAARKPRVGEFLQTNAEAVVALEPDLVLFPPTQEDFAAQISGLGIPCMRVEQYSVEDILQSIAELGRIGNVPNRASAIVSDIEARLERVRARTEGLPRPKVLVVVGRDYGAATLDPIYIAGDNSFYGGLVERAGGANAYHSEGFPYPTVSGEGIMQLQPEVIVEVVHEPLKRRLDAETARAAWDVLPDVPAVRNGRIHLLQGGHVGVPGPRVARIVEDLASLIHPEARLR